MSDKGYEDEYNEDEPLDPDSPDYDDLEDGENGLDIDSIPLRRRRFYRQVIRSDENSARSTSRFMVWILIAIFGLIIIISLTPLFNAFLSQFVK